MSDVFISYVEEDRGVAAQVADSLEKAGYAVWSYERSGLPGISFVSQITRAIADADAAVILISAKAMESPHVEAELFQAYEKRKHIIPLLVGLGYEEVRARRPEWATMLGATVSLLVDSTTVNNVMPRVLMSLEQGKTPRSGPVPAPSPEPGRPGGSQPTRGAPSPGGSQPTAGSGPRSGGGGRSSRPSPGP